MEKYRLLLTGHLEKLDARDLNLESWKLSAQVLLDRIFGRNNTYSDRIGAISTDHSSWSLRDTSGSMSAMELCRTQGRDILGLAIHELDLDGGGQQKNSGTRQKHQEHLFTAVEEGLKVSQYREIREILMSDRIDEDKLQLLEDAFLNFGGHVAPGILASLVLRNGLEE